MFCIAIPNPYFEMVMAYRTTKLLLPSFYIKEWSGFFCFELVMNYLVNVDRYAAPDEMVPAYFILVFDECCCLVRHGDGFVCIVSNEGVDDTMNQRRGCMNLSY